jgi:hypothetical protein
MTFENFWKQISDKKMYEFETETGSVVCAQIHGNQIQFTSDKMKSNVLIHKNEKYEAKNVIDLYHTLNKDYTYLSAFYWNMKCGTIRQKLNKDKEEKKKVSK